jgi:drug/metabolite transporter (DMT)-like permease
MKVESSGRLLVLMAAVLFSTGGAVIKAVDLPAWQIAGFRSGIAFLSILVLLPGSRRGWSWRSGVVGVSYAGTLICYALANRLTTAASTIFLQSTAPLYVLFLAPWLLGEKLRRADLVFLVALVLGLLPFFLGPQAAVGTAPDPQAGNLLGAAAGVLWAMTVVGLRWLSRHGEGTSSGSAVAIGNLLAFAACLPMAMPLARGTVVDWLLVTFLGVIQIALGYVFLTRGLRRTLALEASLLLLLELVLNPLWAWLLHKEVPGKWPLVGGAVILVATAVKSIWEGRRPRLFEPSSG